MVIVIIRNRHSTFQETKYLFIITLSVADLAVGVLFLQSLFIRFLDIPETLELCLWNSGLLFATIQTSVFSVLAIATDQYVAVVHPYKYRHIVTKSRAMVGIVVYTVTSLGFTLSIIFVSTGDFSQGCRFYMLYPAAMVIAMNVTMLHLPFAIIVFMYVSVFVVARRHLLVIRAHEFAIAWSADANTTRQATHPTNIKKEVKIAGTFVVVALLFYVSNLFFLTHCVINTINRKPLFDPGVSGPFAIMNSFYNPVIYALRHQTFRKAFRKVCSCNGDNLVTTSTINSLN